MTYKQWEFELKILLKGTPKEELTQITDYYSELYNEKKEAGLSDLEILSEFGTPEECADRIAEESATEKASDGKEKSSGGENLSAAFEKIKAWLKRINFKSAFGLICLYVLVIIPFFAVLASAIAALATVSIAGGALVIGGLGLSVYSIIALATGGGFASSAALFGTSVASIGIGLIAAITFFFITKYASFATVKLAKHVIAKKEVKQNEGN